MSATTKHFRDNHSHAHKKPGREYHQHTSTLSRFILCCMLIVTSFLLKSQVQYAPPDVIQHTVVTDSVQTHAESNSTACFLPVYFNYRRRQLKYNGIQKMDPAIFLNMCRSIKDSIVQEQVARYDGYTIEKQKLGFGMLGSGFAAFGLLGTASANGDANPQFNAIIIFAGVVAVLCVPVIAIYSGVPHKKRKAVLFRDLPVAYNLFVESQASNPDCASSIHP